MVTRAGTADSRDTLVEGDMSFNSTHQFKPLSTLVTASIDIRVELRNRVKKY